MTRNVDYDARLERVAEAIHDVWTSRCPWYAESESLKEWFRKVADAALTAADLPDAPAAECGSPINTKYPTISLQCVLPVLHNGPHSNAYPDGAA